MVFAVRYVIYLTPRPIVSKPPRCLNVVNTSSWSSQRINVHVGSSNVNCYRGLMVIDRWLFQWSYATFRHACLNRRLGIYQVDTVVAIMIKRPYWSKRINKLVAVVQTITSAREWTFGENESFQNRENVILSTSVKASKGNGRMIFQ